MIVGQSSYKNLCPAKFVHAPLTTSRLTHTDKLVSCVQALSLHVRLITLLVKTTAMPVLYQSTFLLLISLNK